MLVKLVSGLKGDGRLPDIPEHSASKHLPAALLLHVPQHSVLANLEYVTQFKRIYRTACARCHAMSACRMWFANLATSQNAESRASGNTTHP